MSYERLRIDRDDGVATITLDHPPINLADRTMYRELPDAVHAVEADDDVRVVVLRSAVPGWFIAHFDIRLIQRIPPDLPPPTELHPFADLCERLRTMPKATIAVLEGRTGGGGAEVALSCDLRFAARGLAVLNQPEVALGIVPGGSGTQRLGRLAGRSRALEVVLGCEDVDADTAERWGLVNRCLDPSAIGAHVDALARRIAGFPPHAVAAAKAAVLRAEKEVVADLLAEADAFNGTLGHPETQRRLQRFLDLGGQTADGEVSLPALVARLGEGV